MVFAAGETGAISRPEAGSRLSAKGGTPRLDFSGRLPDLDAAFSDQPIGKLNAQSESAVG